MISHKDIHQTLDCRELSEEELEQVAGGPFWKAFGIGLIVGEAIYQAMTDD